MCLHYPLLLLVLLLCCIPPLHYGASNGCLEDGKGISSNNTDGNDTILSPGSKFELGFFAPDESFNKSNIYLGVWYYGSSKKIVVWVANRDKPLLDPNGYLVIQGGNAMVLDTNNNTYWSTNHDGSVKKTRLCLNDDGDLVLRPLQGDRGDQIVWQSFDHPTDTFLPGMKSDGSLNLTCWKTPNNPAPGDFTLLLNKNLISILRTGSPYFSENGVIKFDETPQEMLGLFAVSNNPSGSDYYNNSRLVMDISGQILLWNSIGGWKLILKMPQDRCRLANVCGFGTCNSHTGSSCKCLPGFDQERSGDSESCSPRSEACQRNYSGDVFLRMPMMKVKAQHMNLISKGDCKTACLKDCKCIAYSCWDVNCTGTGSHSEKWCYRWSSDSTDFQLEEEHPEGYTIFLRATPGIAMTSRGCVPCGANIIPYPLSTATNCGDPSYYNFQCNTSTGQVGFLTSSGTFRVTSIDPDSKSFSIQIGKTSNCDTSYIETHILSTKHSLPYKVRNCNGRMDQSFSDAEQVIVEQSFIEIDMEWEPPPEPACTAPLDCQDWAHTTCKAAKGSTMRCICGSKFRWDGGNLMCTREKVSFHLKVLLASIAGALALVLLCGIFSIYQIRKRSIAKRQRSDELKGDDTEGIDVPFFNWESILAATNNFADEYKLGTGGFGTVYKGMLPDGNEIAVKRLSSVSVQGVEEFRTEVVLIAKLQHRNLVRLVGYSVKADEKILVYEFMPNGSLDSCLFDDQTHSVVLDWGKRFDIILGIARGLLYLHQDSRLRIIHRDLKPSNILLDEELNPKISDFGIARIIGGRETEGSTKRVVGTYGYMSPEYAYEGLFSVKSDVFSFGVVVLETISGRRNSKLFHLEHGTSLPGQAWRLWNENKALDLIDQTLKESCNPGEVLNCIHFALLCVQEEPSDRPTMSAVVLMLGSENASLPPPKQPAFSTKKQPSETASSSSVRDSSLSDVITLPTVGR